MRDERKESRNEINKQKLKTYKSHAINAILWRVEVMLLEIVKEFFGHFLRVDVHEVIQHLLTTDITIAESHVTE